jgi:hypothetical protein
MSLKEENDWKEWERANKKDTGIHLSIVGKAQWKKTSEAKGWMNGRRGYQDIFMAAAFVPDPLIDRQGPGYAYWMGLFLYVY